MLDGEINSGNGRVRVEGLTRTLRALSDAGAEAQDMRGLMHTLGMLVVNAAQPPVVTGNLASTLRAGKGRTKAVVRAGGARAPYAGVLEYGWPARNITARSYLRDAIASQRSNVLREFDEGIEAILKKNNLK